MEPIDRDYLILKSESDDVEDLIGRLLFRLLGVSKKNALRMDVYESRHSQDRSKALALAEESVIAEKAVEAAVVAVREAIEGKQIDLSEVVKMLKMVVSRVDNTGKTVSDKLEQLIKASPDMQEGLQALRSAIHDTKTPPEAFESIVAGQKRGFESLGKLLVALTEEVKKERTGRVEIIKPVEVAEPKWWKPFTFSWEPLEKLLEKLSKRTFKVEQNGAFEVTIKGLPKEISKALAEELTRVMPRMMPHAGYNNPFKFTDDGELVVSGGVGGGGGDASEATLQAILAALDTVETKLQSIMDNTDSLEINTDNLEVNTDELEGRIGEVSATPTANTLQDRLKGIKTVLDAVSASVDGLEANTTGLATETTLIAVRDYLDTVETKLQTLITQTDALETNTTGLATEATLAAIAGYLDTVETKLQSLIDKAPGSAILKKTVALTGSGTVHDPAVGKKIRLYGMKFSLSADMTDVAFDFGAGSAFEKYLSPKAGGLYGWNTHPDYVEGGVDENLDCVITGTGTVQINIEYVEV